MLKQTERVKRKRFDQKNRKTVMQVLKKDNTEEDIEVKSSRVKF